MSDQDDNEFLFSDEEDTHANTKQLESWKILIVDDERAIHDVTSLVLKDTEVNQRELKLLHALTIAEAKQLLLDNPDICIIFLDIVMEEEDSGLKFVKFVREELANKLVRIIVRTGQPGFAPEEQVIRDYDINDYQEKTKITDTKLKSLIIMALRTYTDLQLSEQQKEEIKRSAEKKVARAEDYLKIIADSLPVLISYIDVEERIIFSNKAYEYWFKKSVTDQSQLYVKDLFNKDAYYIFKDHWQKVIKGETVNFDMMLSHEQKGQCNTSVTLVPHAIENIIQGCFTLITDITERKQIEENYKYLATHDLLTNLYNRTYMETRLRQAIELAKRNNNLIAILFMDLDGFKKINDTLGHDVGDLLLIAVANRLTKCTRKSDTIIRLGGDEFLILIENIVDKTYVDELTQRVRDEMVKAFVINDNELYISASIGISLYPVSGTDSKTLLKNADIALYQVKSQSKNNYLYYDPDSAPVSSTQFKLEHNLNKAFENNEFELFYQPIISVKKKKIVAIEALIRWNHPENGLTLPDKFLQTAEEIGLMTKIGNWVINQSCKQLQELHALGFQDIKMSVNVSPSHFIDKAFVEEIKNVLTKNNVDAQNLFIEVTENILINNIQNALEIMQQLKSLGASIVLDDFGTGFSSLNYLNIIPVDVIKIDHSFVARVSTDLKSAAIISAICHLAKTLNVEIVVEGVETEKQNAFVLDCEPEFIQGNIFSEAVPLSVLKEILKNQKEIINKYI